MHYSCWQQAWLGRSQIKTSVTKHLFYSRTMKSLYTKLPKTHHLQLIVSFFLVLITTAGTSSAASAIILGHNWCANTFNFFVLFFNLLSISLRIRVQPRLTVFQRVHDLL